VDDLNAKSQVSIDCVFDAHLPYCQAVALLLPILNEINFHTDFAMAVPIPFTFPSNYGEKYSARDAILQKFKNDVSLMALGGSVSRVVELASSDDEDTHNLAYYVLSDVALTQKILRLSNTVCYRTAASTPVTTVSRAIFLLGFDTVKTSALAMVLVDGLTNDDHAHSVRAELASALCASLVGRELARRSHYMGAEEAAIAALFKNLGRLLVASHEHDYYRDILSLIEDGTHTSMQASTQVLGFSFDSLAESVLQEWKIPEAIIHAMGSVGTGPQKAPKSRQEWMRQVASFSVEAAKLVPYLGDPSVDFDSEALVARYGVALGLDRDKMDELLSTVAAEITTLTESLNLTPPPDNTAPTMAQPAEEPGLPSVLMMATMDTGSTQADTCYPSGKPFNARDLLLAGVQDVTQMRATGRCRVNELIMLALETLYRSLGFRFAVVCLKDLKSGQYRSRLAIGEQHAARQAAFNFPIPSARDLFHLSMENDADLMIADATSIKIRDLLPAWHRALLSDARSFIVLPLVVQKVQLGLFYADRVRPAPEGVPPDETALIKALKGQVLASLSQR
jgi:HD-like signal output (HDOD) protein